MAVVVVNKTYAKIQILIKAKTDIFVRLGELCLSRWGIWPMPLVEEFSKSSSSEGMIHGFMFGTWGGR